MYGNNAKSPRIFPLHVLYVEDDPRTMETGSRLLRKHVRELHTASNGLEGISLYRRKRPDVIISDIEMPYMGGLEMFRRIRKDDPHTPLVLLAPYEYNACKKAAREIGVDQYLIKPVSGKMLKQVLEHSEGIIAHNRCFLPFAGEKPTVQVEWESIPNPMKTPGETHDRPRYFR